MSGPADVLGIGLNATDTLVLVHDFPPFAGKAHFTRELLSPGGQVATAMVACARLGLRAKYIGTVGDDIRGDMQLSSLSGTGVDTSEIIVREGCPNQTAYIIVHTPTGERTVFWHRAECLRMRPGEIGAEQIRSARMLHIDGCDTDMAAEAAGIARRHGVPVSLDVDTIYPGFERVLKKVDYLIASSIWPAKWTGEADPFAALTRLQREYGFRVAGMTLGDRGALALCGGAWTYSPGFVVHSVDTTGAGDVFHGAFCYAMLSGMGMRNGLEFANAAAAMNCTGLGARGHVPTIDEVRALIAKAETGAGGRHVDEHIQARVVEEIPARV